MPPRRLGQDQGMVVKPREMPPAARQAGRDGETSGRVRTPLERAFTGQGMDQAACLVDLAVG